jgi:hypothetical protein
MQHVGRSGWPLMTALHDALRRDLRFKEVTQP